MALSFALIPDGTTLPSVQAPNPAPRASLRGLAQGASAPPAASGLGPFGALACGAAGACALALAGSRRRARAPLVTRAAVAVGQKVLWNGKPGTVAYVGGTKFASGEWVGVALDEAGGMHDGTVMGVEYFSCAPRTGVFAQESTLSGAGVAAPAPAAPAAPAAAAAAAQPASGSTLAVGQKVSWNGKQGTVAYIGLTKFASGEWVGVALDEPSGMHDGKVLGVEYFSCAPRTGIFAQTAALTAAGAAPAAPAPAAAAFTPAAQAPASAPSSGLPASVGCKVLWNGKAGTVCYIGTTKFGAGEWIGVELDTPVGMHDGTVMGVSYFTCRPKHGIFTHAASIKVTAAA